MDTQIVELLGRHQLINELLRAELEVAVPARDRGIDLIAYADLGTKVEKFAACPIQMKAALSASFSIESKYQKFPNLISRQSTNGRCASGRSIRLTNGRRRL